MAEKSLKTYMIVSSVQLLALPQLLLDQGQLPLEELLLPGDHLRVQLEAAHPLQLLQVQPATPPTAHTVQDEGAANVNLEGEKCHLNSLPVPVVELILRCYTGWRGNN